jgi:hypothetical protein
VDAERLDAYLDTVLIGGRERSEIVIADYDPGWPLRFEAERERIARALGSGALCIEQVGSTAVPGLVAKPIIDVLVTVDEIGRSGQTAILRWRGRWRFATACVSRDPIAPSTSASSARSRCASGPT